MGLLDRKAVIVTGGGHGIGRASLGIVREGGTGWRRISTRKPRRE
jgi:NAD(P)-dependent dehydrogenase (short-subunit alcohol dehydrogenase family)